MDGPVEPGAVVSQFNRSLIGLGEGPLTELCQGSMLQADPTLSSSVQDNVTMDWTKTN